MATTILQTENLSDWAWGKATIQAYSYTNFLHAYTRTYTLQICIHHPTTPIPRLRLLRSPSVTDGAVCAPIMAAGPDGCLFALVYLHPPPPSPLQVMFKMYVLMC